MHHFYKLAPQNSVIESFLKNYGVLISSAVALALGGGLGKAIKKRIWKPKLKIVDLSSVYQKYKNPKYPDLRIWRLAVRNDGNAIAKNVQVDVVKIKDDEKVRENFIPLPLRWMHKGTKSKIVPEKTEYIDILKAKLHKNKHELSIDTPFATDIPEFVQIKKGNKSIYFRVYDDRGKALPTMKIVVNWKGNARKEIARLVVIT